MATGADVATGGAERCGDLEADLEQKQHEGARDVEAVGQERPVARVGLLLGLGAADRQDRLVGLAGEQVAAARAAVGEQPDPAGEAALDLRAVGRRRARDHTPRRLLDPAEGGDVVVGAEQDARLARPGLRGEVGLPLDQAVAVLGDPAGHGGRVAVAHGVAQHRQREPVDLEVDDARHVGTHLLALPARDPAGHAHRVLGVVVGAEDHLQREAHRGHQQRGEECVAEAVDPDVVREDVGRQHQQPGVGEQHEQEADRDHEREPQRRQDRRQHRVEHRDRGGAGERGAGRVESEARQHPCRHGERRGGHEPADQHPERPQAQVVGLPGCLLAV